jgi:tRNA pseudouridine32 synthase/23S rRNA pseudouridine746 synthase
VNGLVAGTELRILHEDQALLAIDKPAGRLVIPGRVGGETSLREQLARSHGLLWVVHRLDRGTSGVLLFARTAEAHRDLNMQFDRGEPGKTYLALVAGRPPDRFQGDAAIAPARKGRMKPVPAGDPRGKPARTLFRVLERFEPPGRTGLALVEAKPETGRTHQIRIHLLAAGFPLALDPDYGAPDPLRGAGGEVLLARTPLHASALTLRHPAGRPLTIEAPLPGDLAAALEALRG